MNTYDIIQMAKKYLDKTAEEFLKHYGLQNSFSTIIQKATEKVCQTKRIEDYFDTITNGVVDEVTNNTSNNKTHDEVFEEFAYYYYSREFN